jgi:rhamnosyltransferase
LLGPRGFFTDANGCLSRAAWERAPFRSVPYAEDHVLAHDVLRAGFAKVFLPGAAVIHSHDYTAAGWLRRSFDEGRALAAVYGFVEPLGWRRTPLKVWGLVGADWRWARTHADTRTPADRGAGLRRLSSIGLLARSLRLHAARTAGAALGGRAGHLPSAAVRRLSLERRID